MSLTREDLESGLPRQLWSGCDQGPRVLTDDELAASIECVRSGARAGEDVWVFAYGSLMWNPLFHYVERRPATLRGFHRRFCLWSISTRGTPQQPGLVLGLDFGGQCCGLAYRVAAAHAATELKLLWQREMVVASYSPRWVRIETIPGTADQGCAEELRALAFVVNRRHPNYAGRPAHDAVVAALATARGGIGTAAEYLFNTADALAMHGLRDVHVETLRDEVTERRRSGA